MLATRYTECEEHWLAICHRQTVLSLCSVHHSEPPVSYKTDTDTFKIHDTTKNIRELEIMYVLLTFVRHCPLHPVSSCPSLCPISRYFEDRCLHISVPSQSGWVHWFKQLLGLWKGFHLYLSLQVERRCSVSRYLPRLFFSDRFEASCKYYMILIFWLGTCLYHLTQFSFIEGYIHKYSFKLESLYRQTMHV